MSLIGRCDRSFLRWRHLAVAVIATTISLFVLAPGCVDGYSSQAPESACISMTPGHGQAAQPGAPPFNITVSTRQLRLGGGMLVIVQQLKDGPPFRGFFVQAREIRDDSADSISTVQQSDPVIVGRFITRNHSLVSCGGETNSSISHAENRDKVAVKLHWLAPNAAELNLRFHVTVVQDFSHFWVNWPSESVRVSRTGREAPPEEPTTSKPTLSVSSDTDSLSPNARPSSAQSSETEDSIDSIYDRCFLSKGCVSSNSDCVASRNCQLMATHQRLSDGRLRVELTGRVSSGHYLALGISSDSRMGSDAVVYCVADNAGRFIVRHSYNNGKSSVPSEAQSSDSSTDLVADISGSYVDGHMMCRFTHASTFTLNGRRWEMGGTGGSGDDSEQQQFVLIAAGPAGADSARRPQYHGTLRLASAEPVQLGQVAPSGGDQSTSLYQLLLQVHGALMVAAWIGTASTGMLLARYYKRTWVGRRLCGLDLWFHGHRAFMVLTVLASLGAVVCAAISLGGWTSTPLFGGAGSTPHPLIGAVCVVLACLQPLMAACRPHPGAPRRPLFNWLHWLVGSAAHVLAVAAIFFAVELPAARLPFWTYWVLAAFAGFHLFCHFILSIQQCWADSRVDDDKHAAMPPGLTAHATPEVYNMRDMASGGAYNAYHRSGQHMTPTTAPSVDAPGSVLRRTVLGVYLLVNALFVLLLVLMIVKAPADDWLKTIM